MLSAYTCRVKPWVQYSLIRLGVFAIAFTVLMITGQIVFWLAAIIAAIISWCVAYVFFGKLRDAVALDLAQRRSRPQVDSDGLAEDV